MIFAAVLIWAVAMYLLNKKSSKSVRIINSVLSVIFVLAIIFITVIRKTTDKSEIILMPFNSFTEAKEQVEMYREMLMNVFLFVPLGLSLPFALKKRKINSALKTVIFACLMSVVIEIIQAIFSLGRCETDDVICNTFGAAIGSLSFVLFNLMKNKVKKMRKQTSEKKNYVNQCSLTEAEQLVLNLYSAYITGEQYECAVPLDKKLLSESVRVAQIHKILPMYITPLINNGLIEKSSTEYRELKSLTFNQVAFQIRKTTKFIEVYNKMLKAGAKPLCVKGLACCSVYPDGDMRASSDEDIVVEEKDYKICIDILKENGFSVEHTDADNVEASLYHKESGCYIEIGKALFAGSKAEKNFNSVLDNIFDDAMKIVYNGNTIHTLSPDKHFIYMFVHSFKHILNSGVGIRQISDLALWAKKYELDWKYIFEKCKAIKLEKLLSAVLLICSEYFGLNISNVKAHTDLFDDSVEISPLLADIMDGGIYGKSSEERIHSGNITSQQYYFGKKKTILTIFPKLESMKKRYKYLNKYPFLLPVAWLQRLFSYIKSNGSSSKAVDIGQKRVQMLEYYDVY